MLLRTVSAFEEVGDETVFNIEVDEDHSYVLDGVIVHNCQAFSVAGLRESLADARGNALHSTPPKSPARRTAATHAPATHATPCRLGRMRRP